VNSVALKRQGEMCLKFVRSGNKVAWLVGLGLLICNICRTLSDVTVESF
jgi:hypothetical protein